MDNFGFFKVAAAIPDLKVADCEYNLSRIVDMMQQAANGIFARNVQRAKEKLLYIRIHSQCRREPGTRLIL